MQAGLVRTEQLRSRALIDLPITVQVGKLQSEIVPFRANKEASLLNCKLLIMRFYKLEDVYDPLSKKAKVLPTVVLE